VLVNDKKICGILAETVETKSGRAIVLGIGINLMTEALPPDLKDMATSVEAETGRVATPDEVIEPLVESLAKYYELVHHHDGAEMVVREWSQRSTFATGKRLRIANGEEIIEGVSRGLESDGALLIETAAGEFKTVRTGDVTRLRASATRESESHAQPEHQ
jgi:BirA family transcriptional regulator, biotin operon repressor / biotin---[acetyl-CoA-carboxylase] ligase